MPTHASPVKHDRLQINDSEFEEMAAEALDELAETHLKNIKDVFITWRRNPTPEQRAAANLQPGQLLLGLYEGIPLSQRWQQFSGPVLPSKITLFKRNLVAVCHTQDDLKYQIKKTLWHEIAHHVGLDHERIHELEAQVDLT
jgi:predicted Zn-dependent protease with MMP-like domain